MQIIKSFEVDHMELKTGLYISRQDDFNGLTITTFDLRITRPNFEPVMDTSVCHTIEHLGATYFRNTNESTIYFGPMGCRTGFYLIVACSVSVDEIKQQVIDCFEFIKNFNGRVYGASPTECGNYLDMNLSMAKYYADKYLKEL